MLIRIFILSLFCHMAVAAEDNCTDFSKKIDLVNAAMYGKCSKKCQTDEDCTFVNHGCDVFAVNSLYRDTYSTFMDKFQKNECKHEANRSKCPTTKCSHNYCVLVDNKCIQVVNSNMTKLASSAYVRIESNEGKISLLKNHLFEMELFDKLCESSKSQLEAITPTEFSVGLLNKFIDQLNTSSGIVKTCQIFIYKNLNLVAAINSPMDLESQKLIQKLDSLLAQKIIEVIHLKDNKSISEIIEIMNDRGWLLNPSPKRNVKLDYQKANSKDIKDIIFSILINLAKTKMTTLTNEDYRYYLEEYLPDHAENPIIGWDTFLLQTPELNAYMEENKDKLFSPLMQGKLNYLSKRHMTLINIFSSEMYFKNIKKIIENEKIDNSIKCLLGMIKEEAFLKFINPTILNDINQIDISKTQCLMPLKQMAKNLKNSKVGSCDVPYFAIQPIIGKPPVRINTDGIIQVVENDCLQTCNTNDECINLEKTSCRIVPGNKKFLQQYQSNVPELMKCNFSDKLRYQFSCENNKCTLNTKCDESEWKVDSENLFLQLKDSSCDFDYQCKTIRFDSMNLNNKKGLHISFKPSESNTDAILKFSTYLTRKCNMARLMSPGPQAKCIEHICNKMEAIPANFEMPHMPPRP